MRVRKNPWEECYIHPKDIPVSRSRRHCYTAIVFGSAGLRQGRAVPKCRCRSDALRRRCRGRTVDQTRDGHAAASVQYAWPHGSKRYLYVATSSSAPGYGTAGTEHHVTALAIDPGEWGFDPARRTNTVIDASDPYKHGHSIGISSRSVQQSECGARLPRQQGLYARRRSEAGVLH